MVLVDFTRSASERFIDRPIQSTNRLHQWCWRAKSILIVHWLINWQLIDWAPSHQLAFDPKGRPSDEKYNTRFLLGHSKIALLMSSSTGFVSKIFTVEFWSIESQHMNLLRRILAWSNYNVCRKMSYHDFDLSLNTASTGGHFEIFLNTINFGDISETLVNFLGIFLVMATYQ